MTHFFIIGLKDSLILIKQTLISILYPFFPNNNEFTILFLPNTKDNFNKYIEIRNRQIEIDQVFLEEISNFNQKIIIMQKTGPLITEMNDSISPCITGYLIYQSYLKTIDKQMIDCCKNFQNNEIKNFDVIRAIHYFLFHQITKLNIYVILEIFILKTKISNKI